MGRCRVVQPETVRLSLSDGDFIDVKKELTAGEYFDLLIAMTERKSFAKILAYVLRWSLVGVDDKPIAYGLDLPEELRRDTIRSLDKGTTREMTAAIDKHETVTDAASNTKKKEAPGTTKSPPILESVG